MIKTNNEEVLRIQDELINVVIESLPYATIFNCNDGIRLQVQPEKLVETLMLLRRYFWEFRKITVMWSWVIIELDPVFEFYKIDKKGFLAKYAKAEMEWRSLDKEN